MIHELKNRLKYIILLLTAFSGILLLFTIFVTDRSLENEMLTGKVYWFHLIMVVFSVICIAGFLLNGRGFEWHISLTDIAILFMVTVLCITYRWKLNPAPGKLFFIGQLVLLWFLLRKTLLIYSSLRLLFISFILCSGLIEVIWGIGQLYGYKVSGHAFFRLTGSFYNPGPYAGYLSAILPIALNFVIKKSKTSTLFYYLGWVCLIAILAVLPATMSRSAWIAASVGCGYVYMAHRFNREKIIAFCKIRTKTVVFALVATILCLAIVSVGIYHLKKDSADGRLLLWKVTGKAMLTHPLGVGLGGFPAVYSETQATYFASGKASNTEKFVAGAPEYSFNEYLQIGLEQGIAGLLLFLLWIGSGIYYGVKNKCIGESGGLWALAVFAFSSYPLQLPEFWILLVFLMAIVSLPLTSSFFTSKRKGKKKMIFSLFCKNMLFGIILLLSIILCYMQNDSYKACKEWTAAKIFYNRQRYEEGIKSYASLYPLLKHKPKYLFEYAQCLSRTKQYAKANILLHRAMQLSADPMIRYVIARNEQALGAYEEAEKCLLRAIDVLPERLYPWYLLAKLYAEPKFWNEAKLRIAVDSVLHKEPKVQSTAVMEMREEVKKLMTNEAILQKFIQ
jgi:tetratricopeptide (TPR) repeat protein